MENVTALVLQTWFDISIQITGTASNAFAIAFANNRSVTDIITANEQIIIPDDLIILTRPVVFLQGKNVIPATGATKVDLDILLPKKGIGTMIIQNDFRVG